MILIARPFPFDDHTCINHLTVPNQLYFELIQDTFIDTCVDDLITTTGNTVFVSETTCDKCNETYYIIDGLNITCLMDENETILRGYKYT